MGDASMLSTGIPFVCVANGSVDLVAEIHRIVCDTVHEAFVAREGFAAGVIEGLLHFREEGQPRSAQPIRALVISDENTAIEAGTQNEK
eukprot:CAMPEP_0171608096 /NCGR_PEP_ID=MMETSP0990-20121206/8717_1 /TAXON_ID=483369 /ORGANISM="non described non described, Strain CCMP2098" /LENGTH=88 /DNA_ID=CAMNT_0012171183 /DNA_START=62 /DNA_END=328 /DNA_ORIENTATION=+